MTPNEFPWLQSISAVVAAIFVGAITWIGKVVVGLPRDYVPRDQIDARFSALKEEMHEEFAAQESRNNRGFDRLEVKIDQVLNKLDGKADK